MYYRYSDQGYCSLYTGKWVNKSTEINMKKDKLSMFSFRFLYHGMCVGVVVVCVCVWGGGDLIGGGGWMEGDYTCMSGIAGK